MSNVVMLKPVQQPSTKGQLERLISGFANDRRPVDDVFWLKENAELLGILATTDTQVTQQAIASYEEFYAKIGERLRFFPQYYRFLLSLCLDLEDLGMPGDTGSGLINWVMQRGLVEAELSDLQRGEAARLLARRNHATEPDPALDARLRRFIARPATFAIPNKKAAYELTHIVFYFSDYGRRDPMLSPDAIQSLMFAGLLAYLDQNTDLLAEVCTALRFARAPAVPDWDLAVTQAHRAIAPDQTGQAGLNDAYHEYLVTGWMMRVAEEPAFQAPLPDAPLRFCQTVTPLGALRSISECLFDLGENRHSDWDRMRPHVQAVLGPNGYEVLHRAEQSTNVFGTFFEAFARAS